MCDGIGVRNISADRKEVSDLVGKKIMAKYILLS